MPPFVSVCTLSARLWDFTDIVFRLSRQSFNNIEWVLIDYLYEQNKQVVQELSRLSGLSISHHPNVSGSEKYMRDIARNRNLALSLSGAEHIIFLDDYTVIDPDFVQTHLNLTIRGKISCGFMHFQTDDTSVVLHTKDDYRDRQKAMYQISNYMKILLTEDSRYVCLNRVTGARPVLGPEWTYTGNLGIPKKVFSDLGGFDPRLSSRGEDMDFGIRADSIGIPIMFNPDAKSINLSTQGIPYHLSFDHDHPLAELNKNDVEIIGSPMLQDQFDIGVVPKYGCNVAVCRKCGAEYILNPNKLIFDKRDSKEIKVTL